MTITNARYQQQKLRQKLEIGQEITAEDMELARELTKGLGSHDMRVLFAKLKQNYMQNPIEETMTQDKLEQLAGKARISGRLEDRVAYSRAKRELEVIQEANIEEEPQ